MSRATLRPTTEPAAEAAPAGELVRLALATAAVALAVYAPTVAHDLTWAAGDGGELITASMTLGVPHPPGYPTYVVLGRLFALPPLGVVVFRYNLFSAVCVAAAVGFLAAAIRARDGRVRPVVAAAVALAVAFLPLVWSQAVVAEVYGLNLLLVCAFLLVLLRRGAGLAAGALLGLAITAHLTSLLLLPMALFAAGRRGPRLLLGCALGLTPLLLLPWLAAGDSPVVWGQPATMGGWWWLVSGRLYAANLRFPPDGARLAALLQALLVGPAVVGAHGGLKSAAATRHPPPATRHPLPLALTTALYVLFALLYAAPDAAVLLLPALALLAVLLGPRLARLGGWALALPLALAVVGLVSRVDQTAPSPRAAAEATLSAAPPRAILLTPGDRSLFALWYYHHVEGLRPDVTVVDANLFAFDWYRQRLAGQEPGLFVPAIDDLDAFQQGNGVARPFCTASLVTTAAPLSVEEPSGRATAEAPTIRCIEEES